MGGLLKKHERQATGVNLVRFKSGKHEGKTYAEVVLKYGDVVQWFLAKNPNSIVAREFGRLIDIFDLKPFSTTCFECGRTATRASVYENNFDCMFWCERCNPYGTGARAGTLTVVKRYLEALRHIDSTAQANRTWKRTIIRELAQAKGLPARVGEKQAVDFFAEA
jgi:hypothetical protein